MRDKREQQKKPEGVELPATLGETLCAFLYTFVFAAVAFVPWMQLKDIVPILVMKISGNHDTYQIATIATISIVGIAWLSAFFVLWHRLEKRFTYKRGAIVTLKWTGVAVGLLVVLAIAQWLINRSLV